MSNQLSIPQLEQAFLWLVNEKSYNPPKELSHLKEWEWEQLCHLLFLLQQERENSPLH